MQVLIVNDDGADAFGLELLRAAAAIQWKAGRVVTLSSKSAQSLCSMGIRTQPAKMKVSQREADFYVATHATPVDLVRYAFAHRDQFLPTGTTWDLVIAGVNHGSNVGLSIFQSGTVGAAMYASMVYQTCGWALSQQIEPSPDMAPPKKGDRVLRQVYKNTQLYLRQTFDQLKPMPGEVYNINFPRADVPTIRGWIRCGISPFDHYVPNDHLPIAALAKAGQTDVTLLDAGYCTYSEIDLNYNAPQF